MKFYDDCPVCGRRFIARSIAALEQLLFVHVGPCSYKRRDEIRAARAAAQQLELFAEAVKRG